MAVVSIFCYSVFDKENIQYHIINFLEEIFFLRKKCHCLENARKLYTDILLVKFFSTECLLLLNSRGGSAIGYFSTINLSFLSFISDHRPLHSFQSSCFTKLMHSFIVWRRETLVAGFKILQTEGPNTLVFHMIETGIDFLWACKRLILHRP